MRSALKDTSQRNKSLTGFVKCTLCVKFAFSEWNACGRDRGSPKRVYELWGFPWGDLFHFTSSRARYFTMFDRTLFHILQSKIFHYMHLWPQMQCLSRKEDRECKNILCPFPVGFKNCPLEYSPYGQPFLVRLWFYSTSTTPPSLTVMVMPSLT